MLTEVNKLVIISLILIRFNDTKMPNAVRARYRPPREGSSHSLVDIMDIIGVELNMEFLAGDLPGLEAALRAQEVRALLRLNNPQGTPRLNIMRVGTDEFIIEAAFGVNPHAHNQRAMCTLPGASDLPMGQAFAAMGGNSYPKG